jgi:hypothetical protein
MSTSTWLAWMPLVKASARHVVARRDELGLGAGRQRIGAEVGDARELGEVEALATVRSVDHDAGADVE